MTQNQSKASSTVNPSRNVNPKHNNKGSKFQQKQTPAQKRSKPAARTHSYNCTVCSKPVFKKPVFTPKVTENNVPAKGTSSGLGKWKCGCGNKKVKRVKIEATAEKVAA